MTALVPNPGRLAEHSENLRDELSVRLAKMTGKLWTAYPEDDEPERSNGYWMICEGTAGVASGLSEADAKMIVALVNDAKLRRQA